MPRKIIITGASSEIGNAIARKVCRSEDTVVLHCFRHSEKCGSVKTDLGASCTVVSCDFADRKSIEEFLPHLDGTDILIHAAAVTKTELLVQLPDSDIDAMLDVNIRSTVSICRRAVQSMMMKRNGIIINITSVTATRGNRGQSVYAGTKGFIESFSRVLAAEYGSRGIRINCIAPGAIDAGSIKELLSIADDDVKKSTAAKRLGTPDDVASLAAFLCADEAAFINGKVIGVDGGFMSGV